MRETSTTRNSGWSKQHGGMKMESRSKKRARRAMRALRTETRNYFHETSLHGFKYITSVESTIIEKIMWIGVCTTGMVFCVILMYLVWQRFQKTPTVTTIDTTTHPIWEMPFPAVTICNFNKIYQPRADRLSEDFKKMGLNSTEIDNFFRSLPKLIRPEYINVDVLPGMKALATLGHTIEQLLQYLMQPCDKMLIKCAWVGQVYNCSKMFRTMKSIEGFCCSFNYHAVNEKHQVKELVWWNTSRSHEKSRDEEPNQADKVSEERSPEWIPGMSKIQMVDGSGRDVGLSVVFDLEGHLYGGSTRPYIGASILVHDPEDYPEISLLSSIVSPGNELDVAIAGTIIESVETVRSLSIEQRRCWFDDEIDLISAGAYSYQTCVTECRIDHILKVCQCIPFYYPKIYPDARTCELTDVKCMRAYRRILSSLQTPIDTDATNTTVEDIECYCLPQCSDKWYSMITETADLSNIKYDAPMLEYYSYGLDIRNLSLMHVYFRDITCLKYRRETLMTWDGLFASFGGIFGLCLGGSVISLIELVYYFGLRVFHRNHSRPSVYVTPRSTGKGHPAKINKSGMSSIEKLNNLDIFKNDVYPRYNNFTHSDLGSISTGINNFKPSSTLKKNTFSQNM